MGERASRSPVSPPPQRPHPLGALQPQCTPPLTAPSLTPASSPDRPLPFSQTPLLLSGSHPNTPALPPRGFLRAGGRPGWRGHGRRSAPGSGGHAGALPERCSKGPARAPLRHGRGVERGGRGAGSARNVERAGRGRETQAGASRRRPGLQSAEAPSRVLLLWSETAARSKEGRRAVPAAAAAACFGWGSRQLSEEEGGGGRRRREVTAAAAPPEDRASSPISSQTSSTPPPAPRLPPSSPPLLPCGLELGAGMSLSLWTVPCSPGCPVALRVEKPLSPPAEMGSSAGCRGRVLGRQQQKQQQQQQPQRRRLCD